MQNIFYWIIQQKRSDETATKCIMIWKSNMICTDCLQMFVHLAKIQFLNIFHFLSKFKTKRLIKLSEISYITLLLQMAINLSIHLVKFLQVIWSMLRAFTTLWPFCFFCLWTKRVNHAPFSPTSSQISYEWCPWLSGIYLMR